MSNWNDPQNRFNKENEQYDLNTPFGSLEKNPFKSPDANESKGSKLESFTGNTKKCPGCGANLFFNAEIGSLMCRGCGNIYNPDTMQMNGSLGIETPEQEYGIDDEIDYEDQGNKEIVCNSCGSQIVTDANTAATVCPFCGSPTLVTRRLTRQFRPDALIPFAFSKDKAKELYMEHISNIPHVPKWFTREAVVNKITGVYVPFWLLSADVKMDIGGWTHTVMDGSAFYDPLKQEATGNRHSLDVPIDGEVEFSLKNVPFDGARKIANKLMQACEPFDFDELVPYNASYLTGFLAEKYDAQPKDMYDVIRARLDNYCHQIAEKVKFEDCDAFTYNSSYTYINYNNYRVLYCLLPIWFLNVKYNDKDYKFAINGQTGEVCGTVPASRGWDFLRKMSEFFDNIGFSINRKVRYLGYVLPASLFSIVLGLITNPRVILYGNMLSFLIPALLILTLITVILFLVCPALVSYYKRKMESRSTYDIHRLDKMPDAAFYLDTSRKIKAKKKLTKGGTAGIVNPKSFS